MASAFMKQVQSTLVFFRDGYLQGKFLTVLSAEQAQSSLEFSGEGLPAREIFDFVF